MKMNIDGAVITPVVSAALRDLQQSLGSDYMDVIDDAIDLILAFSSRSTEKITSDDVLQTIQNLRFVTKNIERLMGHEVFFHQDKSEDNGTDEEQKQSEL